MADVDYGKVENSPNAEKGKDFGPLYEPDNFFSYADAGGTEHVISGKNNAWIVLGRDRMGEDGYGNGTSGRCGSIDIVVGRRSLTDARTLTKTDASGITEITKVNPSPVEDAARLYLSQKCDVDKFFSCHNGVSGPSQYRSAAALKADDIRIIARNSLKIITKPDPYLSVLDENKNPVVAASNHGVQLIANARNEGPELQPIPKGNNLHLCLLSIIKRIRQVNAILTDFMMTQSKINDYIVDHKHYSSYPGTLGPPSADLLTAMKPDALQLYIRMQTGVRKLTNNIVATENKFLTAGKDEFINSKYHFLN